jgi:aldehyde dehydrogenase (NAD+)
MRDADGSAAVERASVGNLKRTWVARGLRLDWAALDPLMLLRHATQVKNIWVPYGV